MITSQNMEPIHVLKWKKKNYIPPCLMEFISSMGKKNNNS